MISNSASSESEALSLMPCIPWVHPACTWRVRDAVRMTALPHVRHNSGEPPLPLASPSRIVRSTHTLILAFDECVTFGYVECLGLHVSGVCVMPRAWQSCHTFGTTRESRHCHWNRFRESRGSSILSKSNLNIWLNLALKRL